MGRIGVLLLAVVFALGGCGGGDSGGGGGSGSTPLNISTVTLASGTLGLAYAQTINATGGTGAGFTWTVVSGALPSGLTLASGTPSATLSGMPTASGSFSFTVEVRDSANNSDQQALNISIGTAGLAISTTSLPNAVQGLAYNASVSASGGSGAGYTWQVISGILPGGITLSSGTPSASLVGTPTAQGSFNFTLQVTDSAANTDNQLLSITVLPAGTLTITTTILSAADQGLAYSANITGTGGSGLGYSWLVVSGALPSGVTLASGTPSATLSGTPVAAGIFNFTAQVTDSLSNVDTQMLSLTVVASPTLLITTGSLSNGTAGSAYNAQVTASGGSALGYQWSILTGSLPPGLNIASGTPSGSISGTPTASGFYQFTVRVVDSGLSSATQVFSIDIAPQLTIHTTTLVAGQTGANYQEYIVASGGDGAGYTFAVISGSLPPGLALNSGTPSAGIDGVPSTIGVFNFTVEVTDPSSNSATQALSINVAQGALRILPFSLANGVVNQAYSDTVTAGGGVLPYTWAVTSGNLPAGLTLNQGSPSCVISGTPTSTVPSPFTLRVTDAVATQVSVSSLNIAINGALAFTTLSVTGGVVGISYNCPLDASGGLGAGRTFSVISGSLPPGIGINSVGSYGTLFGTPTSAGMFIFTVQVADATGQSSGTLTMTVSASPLAISTSTLPPATAGASYSQNITANGGGTFYTWSVFSGAAPSGLSLMSGTPSATFSGTPTAAGTFSFTVRVTDNAGLQAFRSFNISVGGGAGFFQISTTSLPDAMVGVLYLEPIVAANGSGAHFWLLAPGAPGGLTLSFGTTPTTNLQGFPTVSGTFNFAVSVSSNGAVASRIFTLRVNGPTQALLVTTQSLPRAQVNNAYGGLLTATGGSYSGYSWSVISGSLPPGLTLNSAPIGWFGGAPTAAGSFMFTVQVQDSAAGLATLNLVIDVDPATVSLAIITTTLPSAVTGRTYGARLVAQGGTVTWETSPAGSLPAGLKLFSGPADGGISGVPAVAGSFVFTLKASLNPTTFVTRQFTLAVTTTATPLTISTTQLPRAVRGQALNSTVNASGGTGTYSWALESGELPLGITLSGGTPSASLSGTPLTHGVYYFCLRATDSGGVEARRVFLWHVGGAPWPLGIEFPDPMPAPTVGLAYSVSCRAFGGSGAGHTWTTMAGFPAGFTLTPSGDSAVITGTPMSTATLTFAVQVTDSGSNVAPASPALGPFAANTPLGINLAIAAPVLPGARVGVPYSHILVAQGGTGAGWVWSASPADLPPGLYLEGQGPMARLEGTAIVEGTYSFSIVLRDSANNTGTIAVSIRISALPQFFSTDLGLESLFVCDFSSIHAGTRRRTQRLESVAAILAMDAHYAFDIVSFNSTVYATFGQMREATPTAKAEALAFLMNPGPASSLTATYPALAFALNGYPISLTNLFLVCDGLPDTAGTAADVLRDFPGWFAPFGSCSFWTVGISTSPSLDLFMTQLSGGQYIVR